MSRSGQSVRMFMGLMLSAYIDATKFAEKVRNQPALIEASISAYGSKSHEESGFGRSSQEHPEESWRRGNEIR